MQYLKSYGWTVEKGFTNNDLNEVVAPQLKGDDDFASGNNALYVEAIKM